MPDRNVDLSSFSVHSYNPWTEFTTGRTPFLWSWTKLLSDGMFLPVKYLLGLTTVTGQSIQHSCLLRVVLTHAIVGNAKLAGEVVHRDLSTLNVFS